MTEMELLNRLTAIKNEAEAHDNVTVEIMVTELMYERWGSRGNPG